jgi:hypothetical protein
MVVVVVVLVRLDPTEHLNFLLVEMEFLAALQEQRLLELAVAVAGLKTQTRLTTPLVALAVVAKEARAMALLLWEPLTQAAVAVALFLKATTEEQVGQVALEL